MSQTESQIVDLDVIEEVRECTIEYMRQSLREMRKMPGVHTREHEQPVVEIMQKAVAGVNDLAELATKGVDERDFAQGTIEERDKDQIHIDRLIEMIYDMDRGIRDPAEVFTYTREHWDEP
jgi:hypothetical protein